MVPRFGGELGDGEAGTQRRGGARDGRNPHGLTGTWVQVEGGKVGSALARETAEDAGTQRGSQGRAADAGRWRVRETPR